MQQTRKERLALHRELGIATDWLEALTDEQYENEVFDAYEKRAKIARQYGKR